MLFFVYIVLLGIFLVYSVLILRHVVKFSAFAPKFRLVALVFAALATTIIIWTVVLLLRLDSSSGINTAPGGSTSANEGDINF
jgi:hypothetical protein